jgi:hypothetical protein
LKKSQNGLLAALDIGPKEHVAVVGGGGKSTLCSAWRNRYVNKVKG